jgi:DNA-binding transcriptional regulator PaaX
MLLESTRTRLFGLFVLAGRPGLTARQLLRLAALFRITPTNVRSHLSRMVADGALTRRGPARASVYAPSLTKLHVIDVIQRRTRPVREPWNGDWLLLVLPRGLPRARRYRIDRQLRFDGFRPWDAHAYLRPAWPTDWTLSRARVHCGSVDAACVRGHLVAPESASHVADAFRLDALDREARRMLDFVRRQERRVRSPASALAARVAAGGRVARFMSKEPWLPPEIWGRRTAVRRLAEAFERLEARARSLSLRHIARVLDRPPRKERAL